MKKSHLTHKLAAVVTTAAVAVQSSEAFATTGFVDMTNKITTSASRAPNLLSSFSYTVGIALAIIGIVGIKKHTENPSQHPLKGPLAQIVTGGGLLALPKFTEYAMTTIGDQHTTVGIPTFNNVTFSP